MSNFATEEQRKRKQPLFSLSDGTPVFYGDALWHPDRRRVGWVCTAEFTPGGDSVTVRSTNGAVPTVLVSELRKAPPWYEETTCPVCKGSGKIARAVQSPSPYCD